jgi:hypothetical protein
MLNRMRTPIRKWWSAHRLLRIFHLHLWIGTRCKFRRPCSGDPLTLLTRLFPWPLQGRADLHITAGDLYRITSGDFLNDTLLEFGLR